MNAMSPRTTAQADQDRAVSTDSLIAHVAAFAELIRVEGMDPTEAWVRCAMTLEAEGDLHRVAQLAAAAIVHLAQPPMGAVPAGA